MIDNCMIHAFDTYYYDTYAKTVCLSFEDWSAEKESNIYIENLDIPSGYESGLFYKRELPCIVSLLPQIQLRDQDIILVDGYVTLTDQSKMGLGGYLFESLKGAYTVVGVAKNGYASDDTGRREVYRGDSKKPLFVTAISMDVDNAIPMIRSMHGEFRIPTLLKKLDQLTRII